jgi:adenine-specific DNA glycosylase
VEQYPPVAVRRATERVRVAVAVIERGGKTLMARRAGPLMTGLWEPPGIELVDGRAAGPRLRTALARLGIRARVAHTEARITHSVTHRQYEAEVWRGELLAPAPRRAALRWVSSSRPEVAITALAKKVASRSARSVPR